MTVIGTELTDKSWVGDIYGGPTLHDEDRLQYPEHGDPAGLVKQIMAMKALDGYVVLVDGAFDVPHPSHEGYLRHVRALAGAAFLLAKNQAISIDNVRRVIADETITIVTTVDADSKIAWKKSNNPTKGGVPRPIYPWIARAERILGYTFQTQTGTHRPVIDIATVEGDSNHTDTPFESSLHLAEHLKDQGVLDGLVIYGEHKETESEAISRGLEPIVIPDSADGQMYGINPQTESDWGSSAIINRAQGGSVINPITRPTHLSSFK
ncbi:MAG: hypothetical protein ABIQ04_02115 [Candidatus Saccharimonadales bacterium]